jgi:hypothetical protein
LFVICRNIPLNPVRRLRRVTPLLCSVNPTNIPNMAKAKAKKPAKKPAKRAKKKAR